MITRNNKFSSVANVLMDTTYFGRNFGVMVFKNSLDGKILLTKFVKKETIKDYESGIYEIVSRGISVQAIICDGFRGVINTFPEIPVQICQFHQIKTITKYLTKKPKLLAAIELRELTLKLTKCKEEDFTNLLEKWYNKWKTVLDERTKNIETGKTFYTHKKLRSAYRSLCNNINHLFVFEYYPELCIPNTTNAIDGQFSDLKNKLRNHNGLNIERKKRLINEYFKA